MKKSNLILIITSIITLISTGCKKDAIDKYADVYLAGYKQDISGKLRLPIGRTIQLKYLTIVPVAHMPTPYMYLATTFM